RIPNAEFRVMDAEKMDFPDETFDLAVSRFGFQIFTNPETVAKETLRVLVPRGRIGVAVWSTAEKASAIHAVVGPMLEFAEPDEKGDRDSLRMRDRHRSQMRAVPGPRFVNTRRRFDKASFHPPLA